MGTLVPRSPHSKESFSGAQSLKFPAVEFFILKKKENNAEKISRRTRILLQKTKTRTSTCLDFSTIDAPETPLALSIRTNEKQTWVKREPSTLEQTMVQWIEKFLRKLWRNCEICCVAQMQPFLTDKTWNSGRKIEYSRSEMFNWKVLTS